VPCLRQPAGDEPGPARIALQLIEDVVAKTGGDGRLGIAAWPGVRKLEVGPELWKALGIVYEVLARFDGTYYPRIAVAYERFIERAEPDDPIYRRRATTSIRSARSSLTSTAEAMAYFSSRCRFFLI